MGNDHRRGGRFNIRKLGGMDSKLMYTSYHGNYRKLIIAGLCPINISVQHPRFVAGPYTDYKMLAPTYAMLKMTEEEYYIHFFKILDRLNPHNVVKDLERLANGKPVCLCCYEKDHTTCHRSRVADWLRQYGYKIEEYGGSAEVEKPKAKPTQTNLF